MWSRDRNSAGKKRGWAGGCGGGRRAGGVREPFVSRQSRASLVAGWLEEADELIIESLMPETGVIFSDGVEQDFLPFNSGAIVRIQVSPQRANLVTK